MEKRLCMLDWTKVPHKIQFWLDEKLKAHPDEADVYASASEDTRYIYCCVGSVSYSLVMERIETQLQFAKNVYLQK